jgi:hypothetical protein
MIGRRTTVVRTGVVFAVAAGVTLAAVFTGGRSAPQSRVLGDAPAGVSSSPEVRGLTPLAPSLKRDGPIVQTVTPTLSLPLRDLPPAPVPTLPPADESNEPDLPAPPAPQGQPHDPVVQSAPGLVAMPAPIATFEGLNNDDNPGTTLVIPPDTEGDVGPNHYLEWINLVLRVYDKSGTPVTPVIAGNSLFTALPATDKCRTTNSGDPLVLYDQLADRWVITQFTGSVAPFFQCVAVSSTPDPTGTYCLYPFPVSNTVFNDYPKIGLWPDAYYFSGAGFPTAGGFTAQAYAMQREAMLACNAAQMVYFDNTNSPAIASSSQQRMLPSDLDGPTLPPTGSPNYYVTHNDDPADANDRLELYKFHVDWTGQSTPSFTKVANIPVPAFDTAFTCNAVQQTRQCIPQPGTSNSLDVLSTRLMYRLAYRNFGTHESLVTNQSVDANDPAPDHAAVRWYEIRNPAGPPILHQASTYAPTLIDHRWMGSAAMDQQGNLAVGYSISNKVDRFPSINYAGRLAADPVNQLTQGEATMFAGSLPQIAAVFVPPAGPARWGDYTHLAVDPADDCTFWYINEYYPDIPDHSAQGIWHTRIGSFKFTQCGPTAVSVRSFGAHWRGNRIAVAWRTASEVDALGFNVYRSIGSGPSRKVNRTLIAAGKGGQPGGARYRLIDRNVRRSATYTYRLQIVSSKGVRTWHTIGAAAVR